MLFTIPNLMLFLLPHLNIQKLFLDTIFRNIQGVFIYHRGKFVLAAERNSISESGLSMYASV